MGTSCEYGDLPGAGPTRMPTEGEPAQVGKTAKPWWQSHLQGQSTLCAQHMVTSVLDTPLGIHTQTWPLVCRLRTSLTPVHTQAWLGARAGPEQMSVSPE